MTKVAACFALILFAASSVCAQISASSLENKYGAPLDRETFMLRMDIAMAVDYGPNKHVCKIQFPSEIDIRRPVLPGVLSKQQLDELLDEVMTPSIRGKELTRRQGISSTDYSIEYEHVTISGLRPVGVGRGVTILFKDPSCPK